MELEPARRVAWNSWEVSYKALLQPCNSDCGIIRYLDLGQNPYMLRRTLRKIFERSVSVVSKLIVQERREKKLAAREKKKIPTRRM